MREDWTAGQPGLRAALRVHTAGVHQKLDELVGAFDTAEQYRGFLERSFRFRLLAEPACAGSPLWKPLSLLDDMQRDLADLDLPTAQNIGPSISLSGASEKLGGLYVLEGSALGARLLQKRAAALGFSESWGARHLARQTADNGRWKAFMLVLDKPDIDRDAALDAAQRVFEGALRVFSEGVHDFA